MYIDVRYFILIIDKNANNFNYYKLFNVYNVSVVTFIRYTLIIKRLEIQIM
jgi:hypothetical protein